MRRLMSAVLLGIALILVGCGNKAPDFRNSRWGDSRETVMSSEKTRMLLKNSSILRTACFAEKPAENSVSWRNMDTAGWGVVDYKTSLVYETTLTNLLLFQTDENTASELADELFSSSWGSIPVRIAYFFNENGRLYSAWIGQNYFDAPLDRKNSRDLTKYAVGLHGTPTAIEEHKTHAIPTTTLYWETPSSRISLCVEAYADEYQFLWRYENAR